MKATAADSRRANPNTTKKRVTIIPPRDSVMSLRAHRLKRLLHDGSSKVRAARIDSKSPGLGHDDQVHVLHRNGAEKNLVPQDQGTHKTDAILELQLEWPDIRDKFCAPVRQGYFLLRSFFQTELDLDVLGNAELRSSGVNEGAHLDRLQIRPTGVLERQIRVGQSHEDRSSEDFTICRPLSVPSALH